MITLFTMATGNGRRISILLEELGLPYEAVVTDVRPGAVKSAAFLAASPLGKVPAIIDTDTPDGRPVAIAESLAIALYLAEKTGKLMPPTAAGRALAWQWAAIVVSDFGAAIPGIFFARMLDAEAHAKLIAKYLADLAGYFAAMDAHLERFPHLAGDDYSFADALAVPLIPVAEAYGVDIAHLRSLQRWREAVFARPAVLRGLAVPA